MAERSHVRPALHHLLVAQAAFPSHLLPAHRTALQEPLTSDTQEAVLDAALAFHANTAEDACAHDQATACHAENTGHSMALASASEPTTMTLRTRTTTPSSADSSR